MKKKSLLSIIACIFISNFASTEVFGSESSYNVSWIRQLGTSSREQCLEVAVDSVGNSYISGYTEGDLGGINTGGTDAFLSKYNTAGDLLWTRQLGTTENDYSYGVALGDDDSIYIAGGTWGDLGTTNIGNNDNFVSKYNSSGNLLWTKQFGTSTYEYSQSITTDTFGNFYVCGVQWAGNYPDVYVHKYNADGNRVWNRQFGTSAYEYAPSLTVDSLGNVYIGAYTGGSLGGTNAGQSDAVLVKYDSVGSLKWINQFGGGWQDSILDVAIDLQDNVFLTGKGVISRYSSYSREAFVVEFNSSGSQIWNDRFGISGEVDSANSLAFDSEGNLLVAGYTEGDLGGENAGLYDVFLRKYDTSGQLLWTEQLGSINSDYVTSIDLDPTGNVYMTGYTWGDFGDQCLGAEDAFLIKFEVPEPATVSLLAIGGMALLRKRKYLH